MPRAISLAGPEPCAGDADLTIMIAAPLAAATRRRLRAMASSTSSARAAHSAACSAPMRSAICSSSRRQRTLLAAQELAEQPGGQVVGQLIALRLGQLFPLGRAVDRVEVLRHPHHAGRVDRDRPVDPLGRGPERCLPPARGYWRPAGGCRQDRSLALTCIRDPNDRSVELSTAQRPGTRTHNDVGEGRLMAWEMEAGV